MFQILRRIGIGGPALLVLLLVSLIVAFFLAVGAANGRAPAVDLTVRGGDGRFADSVRAPAAVAGRERAGRPLVPLVLALHNASAEAVQPVRISLLLPLAYRLLVPEATPGVTASIAPGEPLIRYEIRGGLPRVEPGATTPLPRPDTLWLAGDVPEIRCVVGGDSVPGFERVARAGGAPLQDVRIFYSISGGDVARRRAGRLFVRVDSAAVVPPARPPLPRYPATVRRGGVTWPTTGPLRLVGTRATLCGPVEAPQPMATTLWRTTGGGRVLALSLGGKPRKYLYDLDGDSAAELEVWDQDGDGRFEAERAAALPIPSYLLPSPPPAGPPPDATIPVQRDTGSARASADTTRAQPDTARAQPDTTRAQPDTTRARAAPTRPDTPRARADTMQARRDTTRRLTASRDTTPGGRSER